MSQSAQQTQILPATPNGVAQGAALLRAGALVAFPTETVYGLGGDATNAAAVARIFAAKGRPQFNPLIVHVPDLETAQRVAVFPPGALALARRFWPGPLTLVLPLRPGAGICPAVTAGLPDVAIRVPAHPLAQALLRATARPVAAPSANPSGGVSPTRAAHVLASLSGRIAAVIDGGPCAVGIESTILGFGGGTGTGDTYTGETYTGGAVLLRPGGLALAVLEAALGHPIAQATHAADPTHGALPSAPGQLASHYAPAARLRLNATSAAPGEVLIGFGAVPGRFTLSARGDLAEAAAALFHLLRAADAAAGPEGQIATAPIPETGLGLAINDRLRRAAAPRP